MASVYVVLYNGFADHILNVSLLDRYKLDIVFLARGVFEFWIIDRRKNYVIRQIESKGIKHILRPKAWSNAPRNAEQ